jgi:dTDP-glucose 4,6-dehydratase
MTDPHTPRRMLVTGGCGFIGCNYVHTTLAGDPELRVVVLDALTYAGDRRRNLDPAFARFGERLAFVHADIRDAEPLARLFAEHRFDTVVHFAAETHVDRSITGPREFVTTNVVGTFELLEASRRAWVGRDDVRFHHISTDEVFGDLGPEGRFTEADPYRPSSPYSASKAAADHLVRAWHRTYALPVTLSGCSNNFGPFQHAEKLIPHMIRQAVAGHELPVYGDGHNVRDWIYVLDHCAAIDLIVRRAQTGRTYLVGARTERRNLDLVRGICTRLDVRRPHPNGRSHADNIRFVSDRLGHDSRYAVDPGALERELGWRAQTSFEAALDATVDWYIEHPEHLAT